MRGRMREKWDSVFCSPKYFVIKSSSKAQPFINYLQQFLTLDKLIPMCPSLSRHFRVDLLMTDADSKMGFPLQGPGANKSTANHSAQKGSDVNLGTAISST